MQQSPQSHIVELMVPHLFLTCGINSSLLFTESFEWDSETERLKGRLLVCTCGLTLNFVEIMSPLSNYSYIFSYQSQQIAVTGWVRGLMRQAVFHLVRTLLYLLLMLLGGI